MPNAARKRSYPVATSDGTSPGGEEKTEKHDQPDIFGPEAHSVQQPKETTDRFSNAGALPRRWRTFLKHVPHAEANCQDLKGRSALRAARLCASDALALWSDRVFEDDTLSPYVFMPLHCHKKWCPRCAPEWSREITPRLRDRVAQVAHQEVRHLTLTIRNAGDGGLKKAVDGLYKSYREWRKRGRQRTRDGWWSNVLGYCTKLEIDYSRKRGWHPHFHILLHQPGGIDLRENSPARQAWAELTAEHCGSAAIALWVTSIKSEHVATEVAKYCSKPVQISNSKAEALAELATACAGRRWWQSYGTLDCAEESSVNDVKLQFIGQMSRIYNYPEEFTEFGYNAGMIIPEWLERCSRDPILRERCGILKAYHELRLHELKTTEN